MTYNLGHRLSEDSRQESSHNGTGKVDNRGVNASMHQSPRMSTALGTRNTTGPWASKLAKASGALSVKQHTTLTVLIVTAGFPTDQ